MNEYTPTTVTFRNAYKFSHGEESDPVESGKIFDRWLESVRAEVRNAALLDAAQESAEARLLHKIPEPGTGPFTIQQDAADEARVQIASKILALRAHQIALVTS